VASTPGLAYDVIPYGLVDQSQQKFILGCAVRRVDAKSPGAGRAKLRLSRGLKRYPAHDVIPYGMVDLSTKEFSWGSRRRAS
jgi:hypothetical protein